LPTTTIAFFLVNSRFVEMTGISRQELVGFDASHFYSSQEWSFLTQQIEVAFRAGHNRYAFVLPRKDGSRLPVIISSRTLQTSGSQLGILTFTDISEQVRAEEELRAANAKLQKRQMEIEEDLRLAARIQRSLVPNAGMGEGVDVNFSQTTDFGTRLRCMRAARRRSSSISICRFWSFAFAARSSSSARTCSEMSVER